MHTKGLAKLKQQKHLVTSRSAHVQYNSLSSMLAHIFAPPLICNTSELTIIIQSLGVSMLSTIYSDQCVYEVLQKFYIILLIY